MLNSSLKGRPPGGFADFPYWQRTAKTDKRASRLRESTSEGHIEQLLMVERQ
jgi:hypothetical protein